MYVSVLTALFAFISASGGANPNVTSESKLGVVRISNVTLSEYQKMVLDEASKLSYACRMYRYLYGQWPGSIEQVKQRTNGIDFSLFKDSASISPASDDTAVITVFDGVNTLSVSATPIDFQLPDEYKSKAKDPGFRIDVGAVASP